MKIVIYSMAPRGDVFPFVPIASELVRRGHDVTFVVPREFHPVLAAEPFRCVHSGTDFSPGELDEHGAFLRRWGMKVGGAVTLRLYFGEFTVPHLEALLTAVDVELADAGLLVSHPAASLVRYVFVCDGRVVGRVRRRGTSNPSVAYAGRRLVCIRSSTGTRTST